METLLQDLRYVARTLRRSPGFTIAAALTLALGIGANVAVYAVLDAVVLRPLPFHDPERIVAVEYAGEASSSAARLDRLAAEARSYAHLGAYSGWDFALTGSGEPTRLDGARITPNLFTLLGASPTRGRVFTDDEARRGDGAVAVLSDALWRTRFGSDTAILGRAITLDGRSVVVVGVMAPGFGFPSRDAQLWLPAPLNPADTSVYRAGMLTLIGRLAPGVSATMASEELRRLRRQLRWEAGITAPFDMTETRVLALSDRLASGRRSAMFLLAGVAAIILLIACANVANLVLVRGTTRARGLAIRTALGASRIALVRGAVLESLVVACAGGVLGLGIALWTSHTLAAALAADAPMLRETGLDPVLLGVALGVTLGTGVVVGLVPAFGALHPDAPRVMREGGRGDTAKSPLRRALVVSELAMAFGLTVAAGLLVKSLWTLQQVDPGFQADQVVALHVSPPEARYADAARVSAYWSAALEAVRSVAGVADAGAIHLTPMGPNNWNPDLVVEGAPPHPPPGESRSVDWRVTTPDYFRTMGIALRRGRGFTEHDRPGTPSVAVVNAALVKRYFGSLDPVGKRVRTSFEGQNQWATIIGVVSDVRGHGLALDPVPEMYRPFAQHPLQAMTLMVRGVGDQRTLAAAVKRTLTRIDPSVIVDEVQPMRDVVGASVANQRLITLLLLGFGLLALTLAAIGVYGVVSFAVAQRTRELGIRVALGAPRAAIMGLVLWEGTTLAGIGLVVGLLLAALGGGVVRSHLYRVATHDPLVYATALVCLFGVALVACYLPARRAMRVDPLMALRYE
jgi:putative ABC transport system permease protein